MALQAARRPEARQKRKTERERERYIYIYKGGTDRCELFIVRLVPVVSAKNS